MTANPGAQAGGLNNHFEGLELTEKLDDLVGLVAVKGLPCHDGQFVVHDADGDNLLDGTMILFCRAPTPEGPRQICLKDLDADEEEFVQITREGSNSLPDWHPSED